MALRIEVLELLVVPCTVSYPLPAFLVIGSVAVNKLAIDYGPRLSLIVMTSFHSTNLHNYNLTGSELATAAKLRPLKILLQVSYWIPKS
jgi:hypothetical protein